MLLKEKLNLSTFLNTAWIKYSQKIQESKLISVPVGDLFSLARGGVSFLGV